MNSKLPNWPKSQILLYEKSSSQDLYQMKPLKDPLMNRTVGGGCESVSSMCGMRGKKCRAWRG